MQEAALSQGTQLLAVVEGHLLCKLFLQTIMRLQISCRHPVAQRAV